METKLRSSSGPRRQYLLRQTGTRTPYVTPFLQCREVDYLEGPHKLEIVGSNPSIATKKEAQCLKKRRAEIVLKNWEEPEPVTGVFFASLAQLNRALGYEPRGCTFESCEAHQFLLR